MLAEDKKWYRVSLRLVGDNLPLEEIELRLGLTPSYVGKKGEHLRANPKYAKHVSNIWVWDYHSSSDVPFEEQIVGVLGVLEPKVSILKDLLSIPDTAGELFLGFGSGNGQGGTTFAPELLSWISACGLSLSLDLYPPNVDEGGD